ncbi:MAG: prephenate dehydrogenase [Planctomycetaceae bacterium]|nr:prephenate dehydrogenase [Planctomycetaceae bacterium]
MLWHLQIDPAPGRRDLEGLRVAAEAADLGLPGPWRVAASRGFLVEGALSRDDLQRAAEAILVDPVAHDAALARTSHLPHAVAAALAASIPAELLSMAGGAYRDGTRVAGSDSELWTAIFLENRRPILDALGTFQGQVSAFKRALMAGDADAIRRWWEDARALRALFDAQTAPREALED